MSYRSWIEGFLIPKNAPSGRLAYCSGLLLVEGSHTLLDSTSIPEGKISQVVYFGSMPDYGATDSKASGRWHKGPL